MPLRPLVPSERPGANESDTTYYLDPQLKLLRRWQANRLAHTYRDLLASPKYGEACHFFLTDVYGPRDFSQRDQDITQVYNVTKSFFPPLITESLELVITLNDLSLKLDDALLEAFTSEGQSLESITIPAYAEAYRRCDNYDTRKRQIDLLVETGCTLDRVVHKPLVGLTLRMAHRPATMMGWGELQDFLERGFAAFKQLTGAEKFLQIVERRERLILDQIYAGVSNPFDLAEPDLDNIPVSFCK